MNKHTNPEHYSIFLDGEYLEDESEFYRTLIGETVSIAVDGGLGIFERLGLLPEIALGDFDGHPDAPKALAGRCEVISYDSRKNMTDGKLAVELALSRGAREISICGYAGGEETDHIIGNLLLLCRAGLSSSDDRAFICATRPGEKVWFLDAEELEVFGSIGDLLSVVPLSAKILLTLEGCEYEAEKLEVSRGSTRAMRNRLVLERCRVRVSGPALVFWRSSGDRS